MKSNLTVLILLAMFIINDSSMYIIIFFKGKPSKIKIVIYLLVLKLFQVVCRFLLSEVDILKTVGKKKKNTMEVKRVLSAQLCGYL